MRNVRSNGESCTMNDDRDGSFNAVEHLCSASPGQSSFLSFSFFSLVEEAREQTLT